MVLPESGGCSPPSPLTRTPMRSLNLWFTFILCKTRSSAVAVMVADHTAYDYGVGLLANYQTSFVYKCEPDPVQRVEFIYAVTHPNSIRT